MPGGFRAWVTDQPSITVEADTFANAEEALAEEILDATGDGEATLDFDPPAPRQTESSGERGTLWSLDAQKKAHFANPAAYFEGGLCDNCLMPQGPRTTQPLELVRAMTGADIAMLLPERLGPPGVGPMLTLVSDNFVAALTGDERAAFEWRPVKLPSKSTRQIYYEIVHLRSPVPNVVPKGRDAWLWRGETCGHE